MMVAARAPIRSRPVRLAASATPSTLKSQMDSLAASKMPCNVDSAARRSSSLRLRSVMSVRSTVTPEALGEQLIRYQRSSSVPRSSMASGCRCSITRRRSASWGEPSRDGRTSHSTPPACALAASPNFFAAGWLRKVRRQSRSTE